MTLLLISLARPEMTMTLPRIEGKVMLVFDVSGSMAAEDVKPNRMAAAKASASEFVKSQPSSVQIGVVAFSESGLSVQALTDDQTAILATIDRLEPQKGTSLAYGILTALDTIAIAGGKIAGGNLAGGKIAGGQPQTSEAAPLPMPMSEGARGPAIIVMLSDGENTAPPDPFEAAYAAAERGVRIYAIGVGSPAGATLNIDGYSVHTQLDATTLEQISGLTGGEYYSAESKDDFAKIYNQIKPELVIKSEKMEVTWLFAATGILFLLMGGALMLVWFGRLP
jgi:Ca-activated chloride channel family protein